MSVTEQEMLIELVDKDGNEKVFYPHTPTTMLLEYPSGTNLRDIADLQNPGTIKTYYSNNPSSNVPGYPDCLKEVGAGTTDTSYAIITVKKVTDDEVFLTVEASWPEQGFKYYADGRYLDSIIAWSEGNVMMNKKIDELTKYVGDNFVNKDGRFITQISHIVVPAGDFCVSLACNLIVGAPVITSLRTGTKTAPPAIYPVSANVAEVGILDLIFNAKATADTEISIVFFTRGDFRIDKTGSIL